MISTFLHTSFITLMLLDYCSGGPSDVTPVILIIALVEQDAYPPRVSDVTPVILIIALSEQSCLPSRSI